MIEMHIFPRKTKNMKHYHLKIYAQTLKEIEEAIPKVLAYCKKARPLVKELDSTTPTPKDKNKRAKIIKKLYNIMTPAVQPVRKLYSSVLDIIPRNTNLYINLEQVNEHFEDLLDDRYPW